MEDLKQNKDIQDICRQIADYYRMLMDGADYDKQGQLYNFKEIVEYKGSLFEIYFELPDYFPYSENGRGPGKRPPIEPLIKWIQHKRLATSTLGKATSTTSLAYAISWKIAREGTEGKHLLQRTIDETYDTLVDRLVEAISEQLDKDLENDINEI